MKRLTHYAACAGCASKLAAGELAEVLGALPAETDPRILVDYRTADDAGVYRIDERRALVQTVDFFTPIVDDPVTYGRIAAANAVSDVYAMGGRPMTALAIAAFPKDGDASILSAIFRGGLGILREAQIALLGGHTVQDQEIKFGYAVTGEVDPDRVWTNAGARPGDRLVLTKRLGTGVITTALKFDRAPEPAARAAIESMTTINRAAAETLAGLPDGSVHGCTDVTGFGLAGHGTEMARASGCDLEIDLADVPVFEGALDLLPANSPGGAGPIRSISAFPWTWGPAATSAAVNCCSIRRRRVGFSWRWLPIGPTKRSGHSAPVGYRSGQSGGSWPALVVSSCGRNGTLPTLAPCREP